MKDKKKLLHLWEIFITLMEIFHVYYICGKLGVTFVRNFFITLVGNFITLVGAITSRKFYYTCGSNIVAHMFTRIITVVFWLSDIDLVILDFSFQNIVKAT